MDLTITTDAGTRSVIELVPEIKWSGDIRQVARTLDFSVLSSQTDGDIPTADCPLGGLVRLADAGQVLFEGYIVSRTKSTNASTIDCTCYDRGFYLGRNKACYKFADTLPEEIAPRVAADFGFSLGAVAATGIPVSRLFLSGNDSLYDIIATAYTLASRKNGKQYHIGFVADKLCVTVKEPSARTLVLQGGSNLIAANTAESIQDAVSAVQICDENGKLLRTLEDDGRIRQYGRLQEIVRQAAGEDKSAEARQRLEAGGPTQKITVDALGDPSCITGGTVVVQEPYTGLKGLFYIESDTHHWRRGQYFNKMVLGFKAMMDEKEAGS